ncbi:hypothetical protein [Kribbella sp.]|uniref:hypothetical protein n=1 Tax=Kribbella sp. TaxID=1871183 RepID=UPI002D782A40|nr:hypothetical protein [Kribbella sp.]
MMQTASAAATIADNLRSVMASLDGAMSGLSTMDGEIKNPFWQGHHNHLEAMDKLCAKLHRMADGITVSKVGYETQDADGQQAFRTLAGQSGGFAGGGAGTGSAGGHGAIDTTVL